MILLIDNYDSFTFNLYQLIAALGAEVRVIRRDALSLGGIVALRPRAIVLSPGPGRPEDSGLCLSLPDHLPATPLLGVCLGHQVLATAAGGRVLRSARPRHGFSVAIQHDGRELFAGIATPMHAALYHSLAVDEAALPAALEVSARSPEGDVMAIRHRTRPHSGVQFHPESFMTPLGATLVDNFLRG